MFACALPTPRSNIYINGEQPPTDHVGYAWAPGATDDPMYGHVLLTWTTLNTSECTAHARCRRVLADWGCVQMPSGPVVRRLTAHLRLRFATH